MTENANKTIAATESMEDTKMKNTNYNEITFMVSETSDDVLFGSVKGIDKIKIFDIPGENFVKVSFNFPNSTRWSRREMLRDSKGNPIEVFGENSKTRAEIEKLAQIQMIEKGIKQTRYNK